MSIEAWGIVFAVIIALAGLGVERMPKPNSWAASIVLWCSAAGVLVSTLIYWLFQSFYAWFASAVLWCLAGIILLATLIYWLYHRRKPQQTKHTTTKKASKAELTLWLRWLIFAFWTLIIIVFFIFGFISQAGILTPQTPNTPPQEWIWSHPSPQEIFESIDALQLYLQDDARQSYEGNWVEWGVGLYSVTETTDGMKISTFSLEERHRLVTFTVDISKYPQLKIAERGHKIIVQGTIIKVDTIGIELGNCQLIFD